MIKCLAAPEKPEHWRLVCITTLHAQHIILLFQGNYAALFILVHVLIFTSAVALASLSFCLGHFLGIFFSVPVLFLIGIFFSVS